MFLSTLPVHCAQTLSASDLVLLVDDAVGANHAIQESMAVALPAAAALVLQAKSAIHATTIVHTLQASLTLSTGLLHVFPLAAHWTKQR